MQKPSLFIVKVGGNIIDNPMALEAFLVDFTKLEGPKILVHGGGKIATTLAQKMGVETVMIEGRRITDLATIEIVTMVYGGLINKNIVAKLQALQCNAIGLTGADAGLVKASKRPVVTIDYGYVGDIVKVNSEGISTLIKAGLVPIFAPLTADTTGQILNTNADTMAKEISVAMAKDFEVKLLYCFEKNGVLSNIEDDNSVISNLQFTDYQDNKKQGNINKGMIPKLDNAFDAKKAGVKKVFICHAQNLLTIDTNSQIATEIIIL